MQFRDRWKESSGECLIFLIYFLRLALPSPKAPCSWHQESDLLCNPHVFLMSSFQSRIYDALVPYKIPPLAYGLFLGQHLQIPSFGTFRCFSIIILRPLFPSSQLHCVIGCLFSTLLHRPIPQRKEGQQDAYTIALSCDCVGEPSDS